MKTEKNSSNQYIELLNIASDTDFYFNIVQELEQVDFSSIIIFNLIPYLSMYVVESMKWIFQNYSIDRKDIQIKHKDIIASSRNRLKFFDDREKSIDQNIDFLELIIASQNEVFNFKHKGLLGSNKKLLQCDMGIVYHDNHVISSTLTDIINLGYSENEVNIPPNKHHESFEDLSGEVGHDIGEYLGSLVKVFEIESQGFLGLKSLSKTDFYYCDLKTNKLLQRIFPTINNNILRLYLLYFLSEINFLLLLNNTPGLKGHSSLFKIKYVTIFHFVSSIKKMCNYALPKGLIDESASRKLNDLVNHDGIQFLCKQKKFRNALTHYEIRDIPENKLDRQKPLFGFVGNYFTELTYHELSSMVDSILLLFSEELAVLMNWAPSKYQIRYY